MGQVSQGTLPSSPGVSKVSNRGLRRWVIILVIAASFLLWHKNYDDSVRGDSLDKWIREERKLALLGVLANIGSAVGVGEGVIIASPSNGSTQDEPNYFYTWTRDSALTISALLPEFIPSQYLHPWSDSSSAVIPLQSESHAQNPIYEPLIREYISSQARLQVIETRSGGLWDGGLNEPKYEVNETAFNGEWGRPQRDGPPLRALTLIPYANYILNRAYPNDIQYVKDKLYDPSHIREAGKVIKNDLEEVAAGWDQEGFDLWEEVNAHHLWTRLASLRALQAGAKLATRLNDPGAATYYLDTAHKINQSLADFWTYTDHEAGLGYWQASIFDKDIASQPKRTGLDCALPLTVIHAGDEKSDERISFHAGDSGVLATIREYIQSFDGVYDLNKGIDWTEGWAVGRYKEDIYDGVKTSRGNPWFICTLAVANTMYLAQTALVTQGEVPINNLTIPFWSDLFPDQQSFTIMEAAERLGKVGDGYMKVAREYANKGRMSEQIDRRSGEMTGARDLTWSYASFLEAERARKEAMRAMRGASSRLTKGSWWTRIEDWEFVG